MAASRRSPCLPASAPLRVWRRPPRPRTRLLRTLPGWCAQLWVLCGLAAQAMAAPGRLRVDFIAVGQGDAALITSPAGRTVLIDGGPPEQAPVLERFVRARTRAPLDLVVLTHRHADHLGGLRHLIAGLGARAYLDSGFPHPSPAYTALLRLLEQRHIPVRDARAGRRVALGEAATLTLLGPPAPPIQGTRSDVNSNSVVARLDHQGASVLFTGDAEAATERWLLSSGANLRARVLKVAHHGSKHSSTRAFLRAVRPEIAVVSAGEGNEYGHPALATLRRLQALGARVYRTDRDGDVSLETDGDRLRITTSRPAPTVATSPAGGSLAPAASPLPRAEPTP